MVSKWFQDCNFAQAVEGDLDTSHVSFMHRVFDIIKVGTHAHHTAVLRKTVFHGHLKSYDLSMYCRAMRSERDSCPRLIQ